VLACDPERIRTRAVELVTTSQEFLEASWASAAAGGAAPVDLGGSAFQPIEKIREASAELGIAWWTLAPFGVTDDAGLTDDGTALQDGEPATEDQPHPFGIIIDASPATAYRGETNRMLADVRQWLAEGWRVVLVTEGHGPA